MSFAQFGDDVDECAPQRQPAHSTIADRPPPMNSLVWEIYDRQYFRSIHFREPSGVLFGIAMKGRGFAVDEPADRLVEALCCPT